jgi:hypothetical protein
MVIETTEYNIKLVVIFLKWYFFEIPMQILQQTYKYVLVLSKVYSFVFLLSTIFAPWKGQLYEYPQKGFDISLIFKVWTSNMISRVVGAIMRIFTVIVGFIMIIIVIIFGIIFLLLWLTYPIIFFILIINSFI